MGLMLRGPGWGIPGPNLFFSFSFCTEAFPLGSLPPPQALSGIGLSSSVAPPLPVHSSRPPTPQQPPPSPLSAPGLGALPQLGPESLSGDLSLSLSARPVPAKLVQQIQLGKFIEMRDLLGDNITVKRHYEDLHGTMGMQLLPVSARPRVREITTLPVWVSCFLTYLAIGTSDMVTRDKLTYAVLLIQEALKHGGQGWLQYDRLFRQQAALNPALPWNVLHPALLATTVLAQQPQGSGTFCTVCQGCDHAAAQCAVTQLQQPSTRSFHPSQPPASRPGTRICNSWNDGACSYPGTCNYRHVCSKCFRPSHQAKDCRMVPKAKGGAAPSGHSGGRSAAAP